jgi:hypothetical protein
MSRSTLRSEPCEALSDFGRPEDRLVRCMHQEPRERSTTNPTTISHVSSQCSPVRAALHVCSAVRISLTASAKWHGWSAHSVSPVAGCSARLSKGNAAPLTTSGLSWIAIPSPSGTAEPGGRIRPDATSVSSEAGVPDLSEYADMSSCGPR